MNNYASNMPISSTETYTPPPPELDIQVVEVAAGVMLDFHTIERIRSTVPLGTTRIALVVSIGNLQCHIGNEILTIDFDTREYRSVQLPQTQPLVQSVQAEFPDSKKKPNNTEMKKSEIRPNPSQKKQKHTRINKIEGKLPLAVDSDSESMGDEEEAEYHQQKQVTLKKVPPKPKNTWPNNILTKCKYGESCNRRGAGCTYKH